MQKTTRIKKSRHRAILEKNWDEMDFQEAITYLRLYHDLTIEMLAEKLGVTHTYVSKMELGKATVKDHYIYKVADFFNVDAVELFNKAGMLSPEARQQVEENEHLRTVVEEVTRCIEGGCCQTALCKDILKVINKHGNDCCQTK